MRLDASGDANWRFRTPDTMARGPRGAVGSDRGWRRLLFVCCRSGPPPSDGVMV